MNREKIKSKARTLLGLFFHSPLFHKHLVTSCTNQKIKTEKGIGKIFVMCKGWEGRKGWEPVLSPHTQPWMRAMAPVAGDLRRRWANIQGS